MMVNIFKSLRKPDISELVAAVFDLLEEKGVSKEMQYHLKENFVDKLVVSSAAKYSMMKSMEIIRERFSFTNENSSKLSLETAIFDLFYTKLLVYKEEAS